MNAWENDQIRLPLLLLSSGSELISSAWRGSVGVDLTAPVLAASSVGGEYPFTPEWGLTTNPNRRVGGLPGKSVLFASNSGYGAYTGFKSYRTSDFEFTHEDYVGTPFETSSAGTTSGTYTLNTSGSWSNVATSSGDSFVGNMDDPNPMVVTPTVVTTETSRTRDWTYGGETFHSSITLSGLIDATYLRSVASAWGGLDYGSRPGGDSYYYYAYSVSHASESLDAGSSVSAGALRSALPTLVAPQGVVGDWNAFWAPGISMRVVVSEVANLPRAMAYPYDGFSGEGQRTYQLTGNVNDLRVDDYGEFQWANPEPYYDEISWSIFDLSWGAGLAAAALSAVPWLALSEGASLYLDPVSGFSAGLYPIVSIYGPSEVGFISCAPGNFKVTIGLGTGTPEDFTVIKTLEIDIGPSGIGSEICPLVAAADFEALFQLYAYSTVTKIESDAGGEGMQVIASIDPADGKPSPDTLISDYPGPGVKLLRIARHRTINRFGHIDFDGGTAYQEDYGMTLGRYRVRTDTVSRDSPVFSVDPDYTANSAPASSGGSLEVSIRRTYTGNVESLEILSFSRSWDSRDLTIDNIGWVSEGLYLSNVPHINQMISSGAPGSGSEDTTSPTNIVVNYPAVNTEYYWSVYLDKLDIKTFDGPTLSTETHDLTFSGGFSSVLEFQPPAAGRTRFVKDFYYHHAS